MHRQMASTMHHLRKAGHLRQMHLSFVPVGIGAAIGNPSVSSGNHALLCSPIGAASLSLCTWNSHPLCLACFSSL